MTIKVKINTTETLDVSKAIEMIHEVSCQLSDGYWEGTGLYREFFKVLDFEEDIVSNAILITLKKPDSSELVLEEDDAWECEGGWRCPFTSYEEYYKTATIDWGMLPRDYKLKDATREEVIDYIAEVMTDVISLRRGEARSLNQYSDKMLNELISALKKARNTKTVKVSKVKK